MKYFEMKDQRELFLKTATHFEIHRKLKNGSRWILHETFYNGRIYMHNNLTRHMPSDYIFKIIATFTKSNPGHSQHECDIRAHLKNRYAIDKITYKNPWSLWEYKCTNGEWKPCITDPIWTSTTEFRRAETCFYINMETRTINEYLKSVSPVQGFPSLEIARRVLANMCKFTGKPLRTISE